MTTLAVGAAVAGVLTIVRDDILSIGVSNGLTLLSSLSSSAPELKGQLEEMDIEAMLRTVEAVVNEVETDFNKHKKHTGTGAGGAAAGSGSVDSLDSTASTASTTAAAAVAAAAKEGGKELDGGWVAVAPGTGAAEAKAAAAASPTAGAAAAAAAAAAGVVSAAIAQGSGPKWTARKKSSLLHCTGNAAVALAIDQLEDAVSKVHAVLQELEREATAQNAKWFSAWRSNGFAPLMDRLRALQAVLDKRLDLLLKVLSLKSLTTQHVSWHAQAHANAQPATGSLAPAAAAAAAPAAAVATKPEPAVAAVATAKAVVKPVAAAKK